MSMEPIVYIDVDRCVGCFMCERACALAKAIEVNVDSRLAELVRPEDCTGCGACERACPYSCINVINYGVNVSERARVTLSRVRRNMSRRLITINDNSTLREASKVMEKEGIGSLMIRNYIVTETDILNGWFSGYTMVKEVSKEAITTQGKSTVDEALYIMNSVNIGHLPVVEGSSMVGMFSIRDALRSMSVTSFSEDLKLRSVKKEDKAGSHALEVPTLPVDSTYAQVYDVLMRNRIKATIVGDGVVSIRDITKGFADGKSQDDHVKPRRLKHFESDDPLHEVIGYMIQNNVRHVPVRQKDKLLLLSTKEITSRNVWVHVP
ncbi:Electron transport complex subunit RsxB [Sulfuracidifex tepidarius]|uniref:Electron transport complex subunit RsxB n=2 Tax=Sulfuracidifex tepidarius TaxID=1294262 RepID=A0A510DSC6_9CREN|nr:Electron transport complex subunit RsxB [Sulfuracidifex tepidarius]